MISPPAAPQAVQSGAAADSALFRPALAEALAAALFAPFRAAMGSAPTGMPPPPPRLGGRAAARGADASQACPLDQAFAPNPFYLLVSHLPSTRTSHW
jgi:hypothetical protein